MKKFLEFLKDEGGATTVDYVIAAISTVIFALIIAIYLKTNNTFQTVINTMP